MLIPDQLYQITWDRRQSRRDHHPWLLSWTEFLIRSISCRRRSLGQSGCHCHAQRQCWRHASYHPLWNSCKWGAWAGCRLTCEVVGSKEGDPPVELATAPLADVDTLVGIPVGVAWSVGATVGETACCNDKSAKIWVIFWSILSNRSGASCLLKKMG